MELLGTSPTTPGTCTACKSGFVNPTPDLWNTMCAALVCGAGEYVGDDDCIQCSDGTYKASASHSDRACDAYSLSCPAGFERDIVKTEQGVCTECNAGFYKDAMGPWNSVCIAHAVCSDDEWEDVNAVVSTTTDRKCQPYRVCDLSAQFRTEGTNISDVDCTTLSTCAAVNNPRTVTDQYESTPATASSDRGCSYYSTQCVAGETYEIKAPTPSSDRECDSVMLCSKLTNSFDVTSYPGTYMVSEPDATTNTVCSELMTCNYATQEIVEATLTKTFSNVAMYANDRTCADRASCNDAFQSTTMDAFTTTCNALPTTSYSLSFPADSCPDYQLDNLTLWNLVVEDYLKLGYITAPDKYINTTYSTIVKGTGDSFAGALQSTDPPNNGPGCNVFFSVVFTEVAQRKSRKSIESVDASTSIKRSRRRYFPFGTGYSNPPGTKPCAANTDLTCCDLGYGSVAGTCNVCNASNREFNDAETIQSESAGCKLHPSCDTATEYYANLQNNNTLPTTVESTNNCRPLRKCSDEGKLTDTHVLGYNVLCASTEIELCNEKYTFWSDSHDATFATSEWVANPTCVAMQDCTASQVWTNHDATQTVPFFDGNSLRNVIVHDEDRVCVDRGCSAKQYIANFVEVTNAGVNSKVRNVCQDWRTCENNTQFQKVLGSNMTDVQCQDLNTCANTEYQSKAPTLTSDRYCAEINTCSDSQFEYADSTSTSDRDCELLTECRTADQYQSKAETSTSDRECAELTECTSSQYENVTATPTSNRECAELTVRKK